MRAILNEKLAEQVAKQASSPSPTSSSSSSSSSPEHIGKGNGSGDRGQRQQQQAGKQQQQQQKKQQQQAQKKGKSGASAEAEIEREIAQLEREENEEQGGGEREKKLSEEARAYDLAQWEHIIRTALRLQKAAPSVHRYLTALTPDVFVAAYAHRFPDFHHHAPQVITSHSIIDHFLY
jgi:DNA mismatch repair ATPase MutL